MRKILAALIILAIAIYAIREFGRDVPDFDYHIISIYHNIMLDSIENIDSIKCKYLLIVDSTRMLSQKHFEDIMVYLKTIDSEVLKDYENTNKKQYSFANFFKIKFKYKIVKRDELDTIFDDQYWETKRKNTYNKKDSEKYFGGWTEFYKRYPDACGYRSFSRVGFNKRKDKALFYVSIVAGGLAGKGFFVYISDFRRELSFIIVD
jgi:hypothetical protein